MYLSQFSEVLAPLRPRYSVHFPKACTITISDYHSNVVAIAGRSLGNGNKAAKHSQLIGTSGTQG